MVFTINAVGILTELPIYIANLLSIS